MVFEIGKRGMVGLGFAAIIEFSALTVMVMNNVEASVSDIWSHLLGSLIIGAYFGIASLLFDYDRWSPLRQTAVHFCLSFIVFFPIAIGLGWLPFELSAIIIGVLIFIVSYLMFWLGFRWYFKRLESSLNATLKK